MLLTNEIEVNLTSKVIDHYESLGYFIPRSPNRDKIMVVPMGTKIKVKINDLPPSSDVDVFVCCDYCGNKFKKKYKRLLKGRIMIQKDACKECNYKKSQDVLFLKYGVRDPSRSPGAGEKITNKKTKYNIDDIKKEFEKRDYILVSDVYKNCDLKLEYICKSHSEHGVQRIPYKVFQKGVGCRWCGNEKIGNKLKHNIKNIEEEFIKEGYVLISPEYKNVNSKLFYRCLNHYDIIQTSTYNNFKHNNIRCKYCVLENKRSNREPCDYNKKHPINVLRSYIRDWKLDSIRFCNYKCILTGERFDDIHHIYPFQHIVKEAILSEGLIFYNNINKYSMDEFNRIIYKNIHLHYKRGMGVCLKREHHELLHKKIGYRDIGVEEFEEFAQRYYDGEFDEELMITN